MPKYHVEFEDFAYSNDPDFVDIDYAKRQIQEYFEALQEEEVVPSHITGVGSTSITGDADYYDGDGDEVRVQVNVALTVEADDEDVAREPPEAFLEAFLDVVSDNMLKCDGRWEAVECEEVV